MMEARVDKGVTVDEGVMVGKGEKEGIVIVGRRMRDMDSNGER